MKKLLEIRLSFGVLATMSVAVPPIRWFGGSEVISRRLLGYSREWLRWPMVIDGMNCLVEEDLYLD